MPNNEKIYSHSGENLPKSPHYPELLKKLIRLESKGVTVYKGGPLDLEKNKNSWLCPVDVVDKNGTQGYHIVYVNTLPDNPNKDVKTDMIYFNEMEMKLSERGNEVYDYYAKVTSKKESHILIKPINVGSNHFPDIFTPHQIRTDLLPIRTKKLSDVLGLVYKDIIDFSRKSDSVYSNLGFDISQISNYTIPLSSGRSLSVAGVIVDHDPWQYYQIISNSGIKDLKNREHVCLRIDSGCDNGQIYLDKACDCRSQLHKAVEDTILHQGGIIIHIPAQDGRGYGMVTKMETEGIKRGVPMTYNLSDYTPKDTVEAARLVFSSNFDIRNYNGAARLLKALGIKSVNIVTDNKLKERALLDYGIKVERTPSVLKKNPNDAELNVHLDAKKRYSDIYYSNNETK